MKLLIAIIIKPKPRISARKKKVESEENYIDEEKTNKPIYHTLTQTCLIIIKKIIIELN